MNADRPGEIPGFGPVIADIARQLALEYGRRWQVTLTRRGESVCRHHHLLKDKGWSYGRRPDGAIVWTSPLGWVYTTEHPP